MEPYEPKVPDTVSLAIRPPAVETPLCGCFPPRHNVDCAVTRGARNAYDAAIVAAREAYLTCLDTTANAAAVGVCQRRREQAEIDAGKAYRAAVAIRGREE